jgi:transcriptional regulator with XRE-family HTH domain
MPTTSWAQIKDEAMSKRDQRRGHELAMAESAEMELAELREALKVRQTELAKKLNITQVGVSRLERRPNVLLRSISNYVEALGGELELRVIFPNRTIRLTHLHLLAPNGKRKKPPASPVTTKNRRRAPRSRPVTRQPPR